MYKASYPSLNALEMKLAVANFLLTDGPQIQVCQNLLYHYETEDDSYLDSIIAADET